MTCKRRTKRNKEGNKKARRGEGNGPKTNPQLPSGGLAKREGEDVETFQAGGRAKPNEGREVRSSKEQADQKLY